MYIDALVYTRKLTLTIRYAVSLQQIVPCNGGPRECPREVAHNNSKIVNSVFCSFGCCIGDGGHLWKCCPDPNIVRNPALENWNWCTTFLLMVILFTIIALVLVASCFAAFYSRNNDDCQHRRLFRRNFQCHAYDTNLNPFTYAAALAPNDSTAPTSNGRLDVSPYTHIQEYQAHPANQMMIPPMNCGQFQYFAMVCSYWAASTSAVVGVQESPEEVEGLTIEEVDSYGGGDKTGVDLSDHVTACECVGKGDCYTADSQVKNTLAIQTKDGQVNMLPIHITYDLVKKS